MPVLINLKSPKVYYGDFYDADEMDESITTIDLTFTGSLVTPPTRITASTYTILVSDYVVFFNTDSNAIVATLPTGVEGQTYRLVNTGSSGNNVTASINGETETLYDNDALIITYNATDGWN